LRGSGLEKSFFIFRPLGDYLADRSIVNLQIICNLLQCIPVVRVGLINGVRHKYLSIAFSIIFVKVGAWPDGLGLILPAHAGIEGKSSFAMGRIIPHILGFLGEYKEKLGLFL